MSKQTLKPEFREIPRGLSGKTKLWRNVKLGEITHERLVTILAATSNNSVSLNFLLVERKGKKVMEVYGDDVPDDFKQMLEALNSK